MQGSDGNIHLQNFNRLVKEYVELAKQERLASLETSKAPMKAEKGPGLPGAPRRNELEELAWRILQEALSYRKTEDAAKGAKARFHALQVVSLLMRTELAILKDIDNAAVDDLIEELDEALDKSYVK